MPEDKQLLDGWYRYVAKSDGFIGGALKAQRQKAFTTQEQHRAMLGILDGKYDQLWLRLQSMLLPRVDQFETDLARIVAKVVNEVGIEVIVNVERLSELIHIGLE